MANDGKRPEGIGRGGRGAMLLAAFKASTQQNIALRQAGTDQPSPSEESARPIGRGTLLQNIAAGRGRAMFPPTAAKIAPQVLGGPAAPQVLGGPAAPQVLGGPAAPVLFGRGKLPLGRAKNLSLGEPSSSSSPSSSSPSAKSAISTPSPPVEEMEELSIGKYSGTGGRPLDLEVNYFALKIADNKGMFEYHVYFEPVVDSKNMRHKILNQPDVKAVTGPVKSFDGGSKLYLPIKLNPEVFVEAKLPTDNSFVQVRIKYIGTCKVGDRLHLYNVLFKKIMSILKMVQVGRNYFDPTGHIDVPMHKLEIWPGYITAVQDFEGGIMLYADSSFKVLRTATAMEVMTNIMRRTKSRDDVSRELVGAVVLTKYNKKTYRLDDISWDKSPLSTFTLSDGREISFFDYYKKNYDVIIQDTNQPLLISMAKKKTPDEKEMMICLVPELCNMTGLTDEMRSDRKIMRDIASHTRVKPTQRQRCFEKFLKNVRETPDAIKILNDWYLELEAHPLALTGRALKSEILMMRHKKIEVPREADWGRAITNAEVLVPVNLNNWFIVYVNRDSSKVMEFIKMMKKVCPDMGIRINEPVSVPLVNDRTETYCTALRNNINPEVQVAVIVFPNPRDDRYSAVKKVCCLEKPIPSQCLNVRTIGQFPKLRSVTQKIALQINCKLGGELWALDIPMDNIMVCGLDTYHDAAQRNRSILGFVASINRNLTRWFSRTAVQPAGQELGDALKVLFLSALRKYHEVNHKLPQRIFLYRDGVGDGMLDYVAKYEVEQLSSCFSNIQFDYCPTLSVIVIQKRINTRLYLRHNGQLDNPPPGSVLDHTVTRKKLYDFFLVSQHVGQGTVTPTHFIVVHDTNRLKPENMQRLAYKMTHLYYNWPGTVRVPAPCQYAHRVAYLVGQNLHKEAHETLADKLFYL